MDFREMTYVIAIARHQSVSKAANELYVSQPTLSKFVQNLEKNWDSRFLNGSGKNLSSPMQESGMWNMQKTS